MGVYDWIRDGVRQAVLLGFSDAVEQLGVPAQQDQKLNDQLVSILRSPAPLGLESADARPITITATATATAPAPRKRLGKSLGQVQKETEVEET